MPNDIKAKLIVLAICKGTHGPDEAAEVLQLVINGFNELISNYEQQVAQLKSTTAAVA